MSKRSSATTARRRSRNYVPDVLTQLRCAAANPAATIVGAVVGGVVPWFARTIAHGEVSARWWADPKALIVLGCMLFSVSTVYTFGRSCFRAPRKAIGFVVAIEGVAILCSSPQVWMVALGLLVLINAVTSGCTIALAHADTQRRAGVAQRCRAERAATREGAARPVGTQRRPSAPAATQDVSDAEVVAWHPAAPAKRRQAIARIGN